MEKIKIKDVSFLEKGNGKLLIYIYGYFLLIGSYIFGKGLDVFFVKLYKNNYILILYYLRKYLICNVLYIFFN